MIVSEKIKAINSEIEQNKFQYDLDRETAKIYALSFGNVSKYDFQTGKEISHKKDLLEKAATIKEIWIFTISQIIKGTN